MNLIAIEPPEIFKLIGYLEAVSDIIQPDQLSWVFDLMLFEFEGEVDLPFMVKAAYPESRPESAEIMSPRLSR